MTAGASPHFAWSDSELRDLLAEALNRKASAFAEARESAERMREQLEAAQVDDTAASEELDALCQRGAFPNHWRVARETDRSRWAIISDADVGESAVVKHAAKLIDLGWYFVRSQQPRSLPGRDDIESEVRVHEPLPAHAREVAHNHWHNRREAKAALAIAKLHTKAPSQDRGAAFK